MIFGRLILGLRPSKLAVGSAVAGIGACAIVLVICACSVRPTAQTSKSAGRSARLAQSIGEMAELMARGEATPQSIASLLGKPLGPTDQPESWIIEGEGYRAALFVGPSDEQAAQVSEVRMATDGDSLIFRNLEDVLGVWSLVHDSETSSVRFDPEFSAASVDVRVFAETVFDPEDSNGPVRRVTIRTNS